MEMERSRNGGGKVVTFEEEMVGRRRNGFLSTYLDIGRDVDAGHVARPQGVGSRRRTYADGELDVFAAERYFKGAMDGDGGDCKEGVDGAAVVPVETPAARPAEVVVVAKPASTCASVASLSASSAASANSQTVLLRGGHRRRDKMCCVQVGVLMRTCSGKRSVRVDDGAAKEVPGTGEPAVGRIDWYRELRMHKAALGLTGDGSNHGVVAAGLPPNLNLGTAKVAAIGREMVREEKAEFTCSSSRRRSFTLVVPVRDNVPASGHGGEPGGGGKGGGNEHVVDDDAGSESSSDLFEIKSLVIDESPYEPSEASIQWSVVTASAADASERGDRASARWIGGGSNAGARGGGRGPVAGRQHRDRPVGLLAGCASHRAVDVSAATAVPKAPAIVAMRRRSASEGFQKARSGA